jgi:uncharacterized protein YbjT (DUF2867 family)
MRILILGGSGRTGRLLVLEALKKGHQVNALVRNAASFKKNITRLHPPQNHQLTIFEGTPSDKNTIAVAMQGCEAVLSTLNISRNSDFPWSALRTGEFFLSETIVEIIDLCLQNKINRLIITSAWGVNETRKDIPAWFRWFIDHSNIGVAYRDHERQEKILQLSSLQFTAVRPVGLTNSKNHRPILVSLDNHPRPRLMISRRNLARFMIQILEHNEYLRQFPVVFE